MRRMDAIIGCFLSSEDIVAQMARLWKSFSLQRLSQYELARLVDARTLEPSPQDPGLSHVICDIDKTYLETEFESIVRMARIAFETATDKVTVSGATDILLASRWGNPRDESVSGYPRPLHFVSSSPPQLRSVLEEKLSSDGLDWNSDTFKNQAYNIRMGRMDLLRHHVAYKSQAILNIVLKAGPNASFFMIGDNAESDAYIYTGIRLLLEKRLSPIGYKSYLEIAGVEAAVAQDLIRKLATEDRGVRVRAILIRKVPNYEPVIEQPLTDSALLFDDFFQAALLLIQNGLIASSCLPSLMRSFHNHHGLSLEELIFDLKILLEVNPSLSQAIDSAFHVIKNSNLSKDPFLASKSVQHSKTLKGSLTRNLDAFHELNEKDILHLAGKWLEQMRKVREK